MKRTFNYTGRRKIERKDVSIRLREERGVWMFDADLRLAEYRFPGNAEIWVEAHRQNLWMQFSWGTISKPGASPDRRLIEFDVPDGVLFRVKVVLPQGTEHHKLVGEADGINFVKTGDSNDKRRPLLEPVPDELGQLLWKLNFESDPPQLLVNREAKPSWRDLSRSPNFIALVYPEVLRGLLTKILIVEKYADDDEGDGWMKDWIAFARHLTGCGDLPEEQDARERIINDAVSAFAQRHQLRTMLDLTSNEEEGK